MDPVSSLIGSILIGLGATILYAAYKNRRVFGKDGVITTAIATGSITPISDVPEAFPQAGTQSPVVGKIRPREDRGPDETRDAIAAIAVSDRSLANNIGAQLEMVDVTSTRVSLMPLAQLLAIAQAKGFTVSVSQIRAYVKEVTDESI